MSPADSKSLNLAIINIRFFTAFYSFAQVFCKMAAKGHLLNSMQLLSPKIIKLCFPLKRF